MAKKKAYPAFKRTIKAAKISGSLKIGKAFKIKVPKLNGKSR